MSYTAYFQADGEPRYTIATRRFRDAADYAAEGFKARIPNPEVGLWWVWVSEEDESERDTVNAK